MVNKRANIRITLDGIEAELHSIQGQRYAKKVRDVSLSGLFIEELNEIPVNQSCTVWLKGWEKSTISFVGDIVRINQEGAGIRYKNLDYGACELLRTLMLYQAPEPEETARLFDETCS